MEILTPLIKVRNLALQYLKSNLNSRPLLIHLTGRSSIRRDEVSRHSSLTHYLNQAAKSLKQHGDRTTITFNTQDINVENSIEELGIIFNIKEINLCPCLLKII
jgi:carbonyl reductase 1